MGTWQTRTCVETRPERVLELLTNPAACERWSPVAFDVEAVQVDRLAPGDRVRLGGRIAGRAVGFDVRILRADDRRLELEASGPIHIAAEYEARPGGCGGSTELRASVSVKSKGGLAGRVLSGAAEAMLRAGALDAAVSRIADEAVLPAAA
jgi:Polyketide cyclase / dehydrase and lipid transport